MSVHKIRTGDAVFHRPTEETWVVAYADHERGELAWLGWPPGYAKLSDCELRESCSDKASKFLLVRLSEMKDDERRGGPDRRKTWAIAALKAMGVNA